MAVAITETGGNAEDRNLIHKPWHHFFAEGKRLERSMADVEITDWFASDIPWVEHLNLGAHLFEHFQNSGSRWVQTDVFDGQIRAWDQGSRHEPERRRTDIPRHNYMLPGQGGPRPHADVPAHFTAHLQIGTEGLEHAFAVIPRLRRFNHRGRTIGRE